jgi:hypothetical protein
MNRIIDKNEYKQAQLTTHSVSAVIGALKKVDFAMLGQCPIKAKHVSDFAALMSQINNEAKAVIVEAQAQFNERPIRLINAASLRLMEIYRRIELERKTAESIIEDYDAKVKELHNKGFGEQEIARILLYPQAEIDAHNSNASLMEIEFKNLEAFLADAPRYDRVFLEGAKLESFLQHNATDSN